MRESVIYQDILQQGRRQEALSFVYAPTQSAAR